MTHLSTTTTLACSALSFRKVLYHTLGRKKHRWFRLVCTPLLLNLFTLSLAAQSLSILSIDPSGFPVIEGSIIGIDGNNQAIIPIDPDNLRLFEDGVEREVLGISCPTPTEPIPLSVGFVIDYSGSMSSHLPNRQTPFDLIIDGVTTFLQTLLFTEPTAVSITGFNTQPFLVSDFRTSAPPLISAMQAFPTGGGTIFDPAFTHPLIGGISLLAERPDSLRRILIFVTDGEPESTPDLAAIVAKALSANVEVYAITIGFPMTSELASIAERTGGSSWGRVSSSQELTAILQSLALISRGVQPCTISWRSETECGPGPVKRDVQVTLTPPGVEGQGSYEVPEKDLVFLESTERLLWFGKATFPSTPERTLTITARNGSITINRALFSNTTSFRISHWGGSAPPFTLADGESRTIRVQFVPVDTTGYAGELYFDGDPCPSRQILLSGGSQGPNDERSPLSLISPKGGEAYGICDSILITWGGVSPDEPVRIQYSNNDGKSWITITDSAVGYEYRWFPPAPGTQYRIKISTDAAQQHIIRTIAGGGTLDEDDIFATQARLLSTWVLMCVMIRSLLQKKDVTVFVE